MAIPDEWYGHFVDLDDEAAAMVANAAASAAAVTNAVANAVANVVVASDKNTRLWAESSEEIAPSTNKNGSSGYFRFFWVTMGMVLLHLATKKIKE